MNNKFYKALVAKLVFALMLSNAPIVFAESPSVQKALEGVKDQLDTLVNAKDENSNNDLGLRVETFKKVLAFSEQETKDLKLKLLNFDDNKDPAFVSWRDSVIESLNEALNYYSDQKDIITNNKITDLDGIKKLANKFKSWREEKYLGAANVVNDFLLVMQEQKSVQIAKKRLQRISEDVTSLQKSKIKGSLALSALLRKASDSIDDGTKINKEAQNLFWSTYISVNASSTENSSSTQSTSTLIDNSSVKLFTSSSSDNSASSTASASSTDEEAPQPLSIKDLVKDSLSKLKDAYRVFIEMSNLVRKLLS